MAGLDPATQCAHVRVRVRCDGIFSENTALRKLLGRVKPGHDVSSWERALQ